MADPAGAAAHGGDRLHDAFHSLARGQGRADLDQPLDGPAAGIVTDGGFRDTDGVHKTGLPAYHRRPSSPPSPIAHRPVDLNLPIACGGVAIYPGDVIVGDRDAGLVIPPDIVEAVAQEALDAYHYEEFAEAEVARGRSLKGLFPVAGEEAKRDYEAWKARGRK